MSTLNRCRTSVEYWKRSIDHNLIDLNSLEVDTNMSRAIIPSY